MQFERPRGQKVCPGLRGHNQVGVQHILFPRSTGWAGFSGRGGTPQRHQHTFQHLGPSHRRLRLPHVWRPRFLYRACHTTLRPHVCISHTHPPPVRAHSLKPNQCPQHCRALPVLVHVTPCRPLAHRRSRLLGHSHRGRKLAGRRPSRALGHRRMLLAQPRAARDVRALGELCRGYSRV